MVEEVVGRAEVYRRKKPFYTRAKELETVRLCSVVLASRYSQDRAASSHTWLAESLLPAGGFSAR